MAKMSKKQHSHDRVIGGHKFWRVAVGYDKPRANRRAKSERSEGHRARVVKMYPGEWRVFVDYDLYRR